MQGKKDPGQKPGQPSDQKAKDQAGKAASGIADIGVEARQGRSGAQVVFGPQTLQEAAEPCARSEAIKPLAGAGGVRVLGAGDMAVMHQAMRAGMLAKEDCRIKGRPEPEQIAPGAVDQFMRCRVANLSQPEARRKEQKHTFATFKAAVSRDGPDCDRQKGQCADADADKQKVGGGKFGSVCRARRQGDQLIEEDRQDAHVQKGKPEPAVAIGHAERQKRQGHERGKGEDRKGQGLGVHPACRVRELRVLMAESLGEFMALATAIVSLVADRVLRRRLAL